MKKKLNLLIKLSNLIEWKTPFHHSTLKDNLFQME